MVERRDFAFKLASLLNQNKPVIFADEATYGPWHKYSVVRTWVDSKQPFPYYRNNSAVGNVTIFGAITNVFPKPVFHTGKTTNI